MNTQKIYITSLNIPNVCNKMNQIALCHTITQRVYYLSFDSIFGKRVLTYWENRGNPDYSQMNGFMVGSSFQKMYSFPWVLLPQPCIWLY